MGARRFPVQELYLDDVESIGTSLGLSEATCSKAKQLITSFGGSPQSEAPSLIRNRQRQLEAMAVSVVVELARAQSCVLVFLPGLAEIQTMSEALETALGRRAKGGLTVVTHVLHSLVPQEEQEAALRVAAPGTVRVPTRVAVLRATHSPLVRCLPWFDVILVSHTPSSVDACIGHTRWPFGVALLSPVSGLRERLYLARQRKDGHF